MSQTKFIQAQMQVTMHKVTALTGINRDIYYSYLYDAAIDWLLEHLSHDTDVVDDVMQCEAFWSWWFLQAYHRDNEWLNTTGASKQEPSRLLNDWIYYHSATRLCDMANKHANILYNGYAHINWKHENKNELSTWHVLAGGTIKTH